MKLINVFKAFSKDESGAVTVDWVGLNAAIVDMGIVVTTVIKSGITGLSTKVVDHVGIQSAGFKLQTPAP